ncbi:hypothetical protein Naga_102591g1 [Nannochloropsis gaditana]|uniref:Uncharacterized protein n=1 Tax=Nannochloropsis gaditana TaxID=72520 RepID=W7TJR7_9STRA|nr:hypothetical protein Naga_102591g1 [Nannochloropsis gaditana]
MTQRRVRRSPSPSQRAVPGTGPYLLLPLVLPIPSPPPRSFPPHPLLPPSHLIRHHQVYPAEIVPTLWMAQSAEVGPADARTFHDKIYRSASILADIRRYSFIGGITALALGLLLVLGSCWWARKGGREGGREGGRVGGRRQDVEAAVEMQERGEGGGGGRKPGKKDLFGARRPVPAV